jgi:hypothetical protein
MADNPHDFSKKSTVGVTAHPAWRFTCEECNWTHLIATPGAPPIRQCPWCGWEEVTAEQVGAFASFVCSVHGPVTCLITEPAIRPDDFNDLFCPHCVVAR